MKKIILVLAIALPILSGCGSSHQHNYKKTIVAPTCVEDGYDLYKCECGDEKKENFVTKLGHDFSILEEATTESLEHDEGDLYYRCSRCYQQNIEHCSHINCKEVGASYINLKEDLYENEISAFYDEDCVSIIDIISDEDMTVGFYYSFVAGIGMKEYEMHKVSFNASTLKLTSSIYNGESYVNESSPVFASYNEDKGFIQFDFYYDYFDVTYDEAIGNFAFFPFFNIKSHEYDYTTQNCASVRSNYSQTWIFINEADRLYYDSSFVDYQVENWVKPDFTESDHSHIAYSISESTLEGNKAAIMAAERQGATCIDLHIETLYNANLLTKENIMMLVKSTTLPVLAIFYDGNLSQDTRLNGLLLAVEAGASAVDLQGFMYWVGSTLNTQTQENINYWTDKGFDMSFVKSKPVETILDIDAIDNQIEYIESIHELGSKVLLSAHNKAVFTADQAIAYAKFIEARGVDVVKLVGYGEYVEDLNECIEANKRGLSELNTKFSFHLNSNSYMRISRIVCPLIYGAYMTFCYYNRPHLQMMVELNKGNVPSKDATMEEAISYLENNTDNTEISSVVSLYRQCPSRPAYSYVYKAYGASSDMSNRWTVDEKTGDSHIQFRDADGTNKFSIRGYEYLSKNKGTSFSYQVSISGSAIPFSNSSRSPKYGIFLGDEEHMIAFTYRSDTKTVSLDYNNLAFNFDTSPVGDRLITTNLVESETYTTDVNNKGIINMRIVYTPSSLSLYFSEGNNDLSLVSTITGTNFSSLNISKDKENNVTVGNIFEVYMGTSSVGSINYMDFKNCVFASI